MSIRPSEWNNSVHTWGSFKKFWYFSIFRNSVEKFKFHSNLTRTTGTLHAYLFTFMTTTRSLLLIMSDVSDKNCQQNQNTCFVFKNFVTQFMPFMRWRGKNNVQPGRPQRATWRMRVARCINKTTQTHTNAHAEYVIHIAFPIQQWLHDRAAQLRSTYIAYLVMFTSRVNS
jgi:hypothetical protein